MDAQLHVQALSLRKYTSHCHVTPQDYIIILLYLGCMTSSGQIENSKLYNSVSFGPNKNWFGRFDQTTKRSISTKGIRNRGKSEPSISVAQKWWCLGVSHHTVIHPWMIYHPHLIYFCILYSFPKSSLFFKKQKCPSYIYIPTRLPQNFKSIEQVLVPQ